MREVSLSMEPRERPRDLRRRSKINPERRVQFCPH
jgi:hypothetical protein